MRHKEEEIMEGRGESGHNAHSRRGAKEGRKGRNRTDRFVELLSWTGPEFFSACGMSVGWDCEPLTCILALHPDTSD